MSYDIDYRTGRKKTRRGRTGMLTAALLIACCAARIFLPETLRQLRQILFPAQAIAAFAQSLLPQ